MKKTTVAAITVLITGCSANGSGVYESLAQANDVKLDIAVGTLCDPLSKPPINRKYADKPEKIKAINELCMP